MAHLPGVINDVIIKLGGSEELIGVGSITLPDVENKTEEVTGLGVGAHEVVIHGLYNSLSMTIKFLGMAKSSLVTKGKSVNLVMIAAAQGVNDSEHSLEFKKIIVTVKGAVKSSKGGEISHGGKVEPEKTLALTYYKLEIDGEVQHEIDVFNKIAIVDGENVREVIDSILG